MQNITDCLGYVFDTSDSKCYLKEDAAAEHVPSTSSVSGPKECPCASCACVEENVDYFGGDIFHVDGVASALACKVWFLPRTLEQEEQWQSQ